jgi:hypothetical protein
MKELVDRIRSMNRRLIKIPGRNAVVSFNSTLTQSGEEPTENLNQSSIG